MKTLIPKLYTKEVYGCSQCPNKVYLEGGLGVKSIVVCKITDKPISAKNPTDLREMENFPEWCPLPDVKK